MLEAAKDHGLIVGKGGLYGNVLRIAPPLCVTAGEADRAAQAFGESLKEVG